jgi:hypothetical protein
MNNSPLCPVCEDIGCDYCEADEYYMALMESDDESLDTESLTL